MVSIKEYLNRTIPRPRCGMPFRLSSRSLALGVTVDQREDAAFAAG
jgi:hypothetical protein